MLIQTLELRFKNDEFDKNVTIRIPKPKPDLTQEEISNVMDILLANPVFGGYGSGISKKIDARIVSREVETFDVVPG